MKDFNLQKYLRDNPLTEKKQVLKNGKINEAFEGFGGVRSIAPVNEAPIREKDPFGWSDQVAKVRDDEQNRPNKWIADIDRLKPTYGDWTATYEYPGIIAWSHPEVPNAIVAATPGWDGEGTPVEFQSEAGSTQMLKVLDQDVFPTVASYIKAIAPYLDMVEDANVNPTGEEMPKGSKEFQGVHEGNVKEGMGMGMSTLFVMDYNSGKMFSTTVPEEMQSEEIEQMLADEYGLNPNDIYYMVTKYSEVQDLDNADMDEGYMGTQYDSSDDMAVDMVKKGIRENDYFDRRRASDDDMRTMPSSNERLEGLVDQRQLAKFGEAVMAIAQDLMDEGFEEDDVKRFLARFLNEMIID